MAQRKPTPTEINDNREMSDLGGQCPFGFSDYEVLMSTACREHLDRLLGGDNKIRRDNLVKFLLAYDHSQYISKNLPVPKVGNVTIKPKIKGEPGITIQIEEEHERIVAWLPREKNNIVIEAGSTCPHCRHDIAVKLATYMDARSAAEQTEHSLTVENYCELLEEEPHAEFFGITVGYDPTRLVSDRQNPDFFRSWRN